MSDNMGEENNDNVLYLNGVKLGTLESLDSYSCDSIDLERERQFHSKTRNMISSLIQSQEIEIEGSFNQNINYLLFTKQERKEYNLYKTAKSKRQKKKQLKKQILNYLQS
jgi:hypothetical protein